jgi:hypothetical protein
MIISEEPSQYRNSLQSYMEDDIEGDFHRATFFTSVEQSWRVADNAIRLVMAVVAAPKTVLPADEIPEDKRGTHYGMAFSDPFFAGMIIGMGEMFASFNQNGAWALDALSPILIIHSAEDRMRAVKTMMKDYNGEGPAIDMSDTLGMGGVTAASALVKHLKMPLPPSLDINEDQQKEWTKQLFPWYENYQMIRQMALNFDVHLADHISAAEEVEVTEIIGDNLDAQLRDLLGGEAS